MNFNIKTLFCILFLIIHICVDNFIIEWIVVVLSIVSIVRIDILSKHLSSPSFSCLPAVVNSAAGGHTHNDNCNHAAYRGVDYGWFR